MRLLLTGATGFIGGRLLRRLAASHDIVAVARSVPADATPRVEWVEHDLARPLHHASLPSRVDAVVHLAQSKRYRDFPEGARDIFAVNVRSTFDLLEYARTAGASTFVFASTGGVYGASERPFVESDRLNPLNFYLTSKYSAEALVSSYQTFFRTVTFRFFFVYGPGQRRMLVPSLLERVLDSQTITIDGNPGLRINPIYVEDAVRAIEPALEHGDSDLFNVAGDEVVTILDLVRAMEQASGREASIVHSDRPPAGDLIGDNTRMKEVLGVRPGTPLLEGLRSMLLSG
jgi:nucleoside-diphosphate-sugar epimerase